jgi:hypothetical protein
MNKNVTIVLPVSRKEHVDAIFARLELLECDRTRTNLLVVVDGPPDLFVLVRNKVELSKFEQRLCLHFKSTHELRYYDRPSRRLRISDVHNFAKQHIVDCDFVFGLEDDTIFPLTALEKLLKDYVLYPFAGAIEGVQLGRHGIRHVGGWKVDDPYDPKQVESVAFDSGVTELDAGGFYCFLTPREYYIKHEFKPFDVNELGPDVDYGLSLRRMGLQNYIDWDVKTIHKSKHGDVPPSPDGLRIVRFRKNDKGRWRQTSL